MWSYDIRRVCDVEIFACCFGRCAFCLRPRCLGAERRVSRWIWGGAAAFMAADSAVEAAVFVEDLQGPVVAHFVAG